jgi:hypothetical protein
MSRPLRPATEDEANCLKAGIDALRRARYWIKAANSPRTLARLDAAIRSAGGAERHMRHRLRKTSEATDAA